ncbi:RHS repeat-associated core domain-containing protein [Tateyamaria pelophila]|uniref:RHS repeat-associated core domain-containing protein n=1 Tax=Tateyamaria pelophila TaxID=328415 RepID=UPI001CBE6F41|nr:RHS repeat-associated core domain-containing protein [Tateyamaria pelophila]
MRFRNKLLPLLVGMFAFLSTVALAQEDDLVFAAPPDIISPLPSELALPETFHTDIVDMSGRLGFGFVDLSIGARDWPLTMSRHYSQGALNTGMGPNWAWAFATRIERDRNTGTLYVYEDNGGQSAYVQTAGSGYEPTAGRLEAKIYALPDGGFRRLYSDGSQEVFNADLKLARRQGPQGFGYDLLYENGQLAKVVHDDGQALALSWDSGRVVQIADMLNRVVRFEYAGGVLARTIDTRGRETVFDYGDAAILTGVTFVDGASLEIEYDVNSRVRRLTGPGALSTAFDHWGRAGDGRLVQTRTDAAGQQHRSELIRDPVMTDQYTIIDTQPDGIRVVRDHRDGQVDVSINGEWVGGVIFDAVGDPRLLVDENGTLPLPETGSTDVSYAAPDTYGHPQLVFRAEGSFWQKSDPIGRVTAIAGETGQVERFTYDEADQLISHLDLEGIETYYTYDAADRPKSWRTSDGRWMEYVYTPEGLISDIRGSGTSPLHYTYDPLARLDTLSDGAQILKAHYRSDGLIEAMLDGDGNGIRFRRDTVGRMLEIEDVGGVSIALDPSDGTVMADGAGRVRGLVIDDQGAEAFAGERGALSYTEELEDGGRLVTTILPSGDGQIERLDASGALISAERLSDEPFIIETDEQGMVVRAGDPLMPSVISYSQDGYVTEIVDEIGVPTLYEHDESGRLNAVSSPYLAFELIYEEGGETPVALRSSDGVTLTQTVSDDGGTLRYTSLDAAGIERQEIIELDDQGRVVRQVVDTVVTEMRYVDEKTTEMTTTNGDRVLSWVEVFDPDRNQSTLTRPDGTQTVTTFDASGRVVAQMSPEMQISYEFDPEGQILAATVDGIRSELGDNHQTWTVIEEVQVEPSDDGVVRIQTIEDPRGNLWQAGIGYDGTELWSKDPLGGVTTVQRAATGQITEVIDPDGRIQYAVYDDLGRAIEMGALSGWAKAFGWEGTMPSGQSYSGGSQILIEPSEDWSSFSALVNGEIHNTIRFDENGRLSEAENAIGVIRYRYAEDGASQSVTDALGRQLSFEYDSLGRMTALVLPEGDRIGYAYPLGEGQVQIGPDGTRTQTVYDPSKATYHLTTSDGAEADVLLATNSVLAEVEVRAGAGSEGRLTVERAEDNAVSALTLNGQTQRMERDALGRLVAVNEGDVRLEWSYDGSGNVLTTPDVDDRAYNSAWQLSENQGETLAYDMDGQLIQNGQITYTYDAAGQLVSVSDGARNVAFDYDAFGQIVRRTAGDQIEEYLWFEGRLIAVYGADGARIALIERNEALPNYVRLHMGDEVRLLVPNQIGTPVFEVVGGETKTLALYDTWGQSRDAPADFARWVGYAGGLTDPEFGLIHTDARVYLPALQRFNAPDPMGIDNPSNPYAYAALDPLSYADTDGHEAHTVGTGGGAPQAGGPMPGRGYPPGNVGSNPRYRNAYNAMVRDLESIIANDSRPSVRSGANQTLQQLRSPATNLHFGSDVAGYGYQQGGNLHVNPGRSVLRDPRAAAGIPSPRGLTGVVGHEGRHLYQRGLEQNGRYTMGRLWKEFDAHLHGSNLERAAGGFHPPGSERRLMRQSMNYAFQTEYRQYLPRGADGHLPNTFQNSPYRAARSYTPWTGFSQMTPETIVRNARLHMPEVPAHHVLDDWVRTAEHYRSSPAHEYALRNSHLGHDAAYTRDHMIRQARAAASRARTAALAPPRPMPQLPNSPGAVASATNPPPAARSIPRTSPNRATIDPARANAPDAPRPPARTAPPPQPARHATQRLPAVDSPAARTQAPNARTTQRLPAVDLPANGRPPSTSPRPSGSAPNTARPSAPRPPHTTAPRPRPPRVQAPTARPRPPATQAPPARNPRPVASPNRPPVQPASAPERPIVRPQPSTPDAPRTPRTPTPDASGPRSLPDRPAVPDTARPSPSAPRPSAQGGRYRVPDLDGGPRVSPPPRTAGGTPTARPPRTARARLYGSPPSGGSGLGRGFGRALGALSIASDVYSTHLYLTGQIGHREYWTGMALSGAGMVLPYPLNAAIAAHQVGGALGNYLAYRLLDAARNGDKAAQAFLSFLQRSGFINANDPTFVAMSEYGPPLLRGGSMLMVAGQPQWVALTLWSESAQDVSLVLVEPETEEEQELASLSLVPGANPQLFAPDMFVDLTIGTYAILIVGADGTRTPAYLMGVIDTETDSTGTDTTAAFSAVISVAETRLKSTDLPWERFDRPEPLLAQAPDEGVTLGGAWIWEEVTTGPTDQAHIGGGSGPPVHYLLWDAPHRVIAGDNIIQYVYLHPETPPAQIVLQVYDETLSAAHRASFGADLLPFEDRSGYGHIASGPLPLPGTWMRLRIPVSEIGMGGRDIAGLAFYAVDGKAYFGPTRLSGGEDVSPRIVSAADRDYSGAPEADLTAELSLPEPGDLTLTLVLGNDAEVPLFSGPIAAGQRYFWWQGDAGIANGARLRGQYAPAGGDTIDINTNVGGNPALVARLLYPPQGAVVRQTVPIFGQAGGKGFSHYLVEMRSFGTGDESWQELIRSTNPTVMTQQEVTRRIDTILSQQLRSTVYGNLASLDTGSALHSFEFAESGPVMKSGWIEVRLRSFDAEENFAEASTMVRVGEVATGQDNTTLTSPDGLASLSLPPFALNLGMGALSVDVADNALPPNAPEAAGRLYGFAPQGLAFRAPVTLSLESEAGRSVALLDASGAVTVLATQRNGNRIEAQVPSSLRPTRFYATMAEPPQPSSQPTQSNAPWFADAPEPGLQLAVRDPGRGVVDFAAPVSLDQPLGLVAQIQIGDTSGLALLLRFDGDARLVPLGSERLGSRAALTTPPLNLEPGDAPQPIFLLLSEYLPQEARLLEGVELVKISSAAWRTFAADVPPQVAAQLLSLSIGTLPNTAETWALPSGEALAAENEGWQSFMSEDGQIWVGLIDRTPPLITTTEPAEAGESSELLPRISFMETGAGIARVQTELTVNGISVPTEIIQFDTVRSSMSVRLGEVPGLSVPNGGEVIIRLVLVDQLGHRSDPLEWRWRYRAQALAFGNLTQLTVDGGRTPAWLPDGSGFIFASQREGQFDIASYDLASAQITWLTETGGNETNPVIGPDGQMGYLTETGLVVQKSSGDEQSIDGDFSGLGWIADQWLATTENRIVDPFELDVSICEFAGGATMLNPRPIGRQVLVTQSIYHRTTWLCDLETGTTMVLSAHPDAPATRDLDATAITDEAYLFAKADGEGGLWRREVGARRESLVLDNDGGLDRAMMVSPDGSSMLFESGRSGRQEIWRMEFDQSVDFSLDQDRVSGAVDAPLTGFLEGRSEDLAWRLLDADGQTEDIAFEVNVENGVFQLTSAEALPEGIWQLEMETANGIGLRRELIVDRSPPVLSIALERDPDQLDLSALSATDRIVLSGADLTNFRMTDAATGATLVAGHAFAPRPQGSEPLQIIATDELGITTNLILDLSIGVASAPRLARIDDAKADMPENTPPVLDEPEDSIPTEETSEDTRGVPWVLLLIGLLVIGGGATVALRRSR